MQLTSRMPAGYDFLLQPNEVAAAVLEKSTGAVHHIWNEL
jgi:hypothetical protein